MKQIDIFHSIESRWIRMIDPYITIPEGTLLLKQQGFISINLKYDRL